MLHRILMVRGAVLHFTCTVQNQLINQDVHKSTKRAAPKWFPELRTNQFIMCKQTYKQFADFTICLSARVSLLQSIDYRAETQELISLIIYILILLLEYKDHNFLCVAISITQLHLFSLKCPVLKFTKTYLSQLTQKACLWQSTYVSQFEI